MNKRARKNIRVLISFLLVVVMVCSNVGMNLGPAYAEGEKLTSQFLISGSELKGAVKEAVEAGQPFDFSTLDLQADSKKTMASYEELFGGAEGEVYELGINVDGSYAIDNTELQVFYHAGTEEIIFLFINGGDSAVTCVANIDGYRTKGVSVKPNGANIDSGKEKPVSSKNDVVAKPVEEEVPEGSHEAVETEVETEVEAEVETEVETTEPVQKQEPEEAPTEAEVPTEAEMPTEVEVPTEAEAPAEAEVPDGADAEQGQDAGTEVVLVGMSVHKVFRVASSENLDSVDDGTSIEDAAEENAEENVEENIDESVEEDTEVTGDVIEAEETTEEETTEETLPVVEYEERTLEDHEDDLPPDFGELVGKAYRTVTIWEYVNAAAYGVKLDEIKRIVANEQYHVNYWINLPEAARIQGAGSVESGENLYFAVVPADGYELAQVTVNGAELEPTDPLTLDEESEWLGYAHLYEIQEVEEEVFIEVEMVREGYPAFHQSVVVNGVTITAKAKANVIPDGTILEAKEITSEIEDVVKEKVDGEENAEDTEIDAKVLAYDINLMLHGEKLENNWAESGRVEVTFSGSRIDKLAREAESLNVFAANNDHEGNLEPESVKKVTADSLQLETVATKTRVNSAKDVAFEAEHFSTYVLYFAMNNNKSGKIVFHQVNSEGKEIGGGLQVGEELNKVISSYGKTISKDTLINYFKTDGIKDTITWVDEQNKTIYYSGDKISLLTSTGDTIDAIKFDSSKLTNILYRKTTGGTFQTLEKDENGSYHLYLVYPEAPKVYFNLVDMKKNMITPGKESEWVWLKDLQQYENGLSLGWTEVTAEMVGNDESKIPTTSIFDLLTINQNDMIQGEDGKSYMLRKVCGAFKNQFADGRSDEAYLIKFMDYGTSRPYELLYKRKTGWQDVKAENASNKYDYNIYLVYDAMPMGQKLTFQFLDQEGGKLAEPVESSTVKFEQKKIYTITTVPREAQSGTQDVADIVKELSSKVGDRVFVSANINGKTAVQFSWEKEDVKYSDKFTSSSISQEKALPDADGGYTISLIYADKGSSAYVKNGETKWSKQKLTTLAETSEQIAVQWDKAAEEIIITIPEGYNRDNININLTEELHKALKDQWGVNELLVLSKIQPGDKSGPVNIRIVNHSGKEFSYVNGSMVITPYQYEPYGDAGSEEYSFINGVLSPGYIGVEGFDGNNPWYSYGVSRTQNAALHALYGKAALSQSDFTDEMLDARLKAAGYSGIDELNVYYLNYWNQQKGTNHSSLSEFNTKELLGTINGNSVTGASYSIKETNAEVAALGYDLFYNALFGLTRATVIDSNNPAFNEVEAYSIGSYMRGDRSFDQDCRAVWGTISPTRTGEAGNHVLSDLRFWIDGEMTGNPYLAFNFGVQMGFQLQHRTGEGGSTPGGNPGGNPGGSTITPNPVPRANLPETPGELVVIDEEEVPLAPLPKTGDSGAGEWWFLLSGAVLTILAMTEKKKKRREE